MTTLLTKNTTKRNSAIAIAYQDYLNEPETLRMGKIEDMFPHHVFV